MLLAAIELEFPALWPASVAVAAFTALYAYRALSRGLRPMLVLMRSLSLLILAACIVGPILRRAAKPGEESALAIVVDASASMSIADTQRPLADQLRLATTLGLVTLPPDIEQTNQAAESLLTAVSDDVTALIRAREAAEYVDLTRQDPAAARAKLTAAQAALTARLASVKDSFLPDDAKSALATLAANLPNNLDEAPRLLVAASEALRDSQSAALRLLAATSPEVSEAIRKIAGMSRFDLALALASARSRPLAAALPPGTPVRMYALSSDLLPLTRDTRPNGSTTDFTELARLTAATVRTAGNARTRFLGTPELPIRAILLLTDGRSTAIPTDDSTGTTGGYGSLPIFSLNLAPTEPPRAVTLESLDLPSTLVVGQSARIHAKIRPTGIDGVATVRLLAAGQTQYRSLAVRAGESATVDFDLVADRAGEFAITLAVDPPAGASPGSALQARRTITVLPSRYHIVCLLSPTRGWDAQLLIEQLQANPALQLSFPTETDNLADEFRDADAIILEDTDPARLSPTAREALLQRTLQQGVGLLLLPGPHFLPEAWSADSDLSRLLPKPLTWKTDLVPDASYWHTLSPVSNLKSQISNPTYIRSAPVVLPPTDQLWRSRILGANSFPDLLSPLLEAPYTESNGGDSLSATVTGNGRTLTVRARRLDSSGAPAQLVPPSITLQTEDQGIRSIQMSRAAPGRYITTFRDLPDGEYTIRLLDEIDPRITVTIGQSAEAELINPAGDAAHLAFISTTTGGATGPAEDIDALATRLAHRLATTVTTRTTRLWCAPATLVILLALLSAEWALRKHWGLA